MPPPRAPTAKKVMPPRAGVAIGNDILDLWRLEKASLLANCGLTGKKIFRRDSLNLFLAEGKEVTRNVREAVSQLLSADHAVLKENTKLRKKALVPMSDVEMLMPVKPGDYTDFYSSIDHAKNVGSILRDPENALLPNWKHLPVGYHGRSSSIVCSGVDIIRPKGQFKPKDEDSPRFGPSQRMDFELETAFVTCGQSALGTSISIRDAENYIFGFLLFNDWSARDIQAWEYAPLGPFLGKNFASSVSPWIVTMDALEPFKIPGPVQDPPVLPYLTYSGNHHYDVNMEVAIETPDNVSTVVTRSNFKYLYWNFLQQLAHHSVNGCNVNPADVYASGTISGPAKESYGSLLELSWSGTNPIQLEDGTQRTFLQDGDTVIMKAFAEKEGVRISFGELRNRLVAANE